jgi:nicotinamide-nucleotide amidase
MTAELINTGSELLLGQVTNTHLPFLAKALFPIGIRINRQVTVPDGPDIRTALKESFSRSQVVIVTGGLGPTTDDITRECVADLLGLPLHECETTRAAISERLSRRGIAPTERTFRQAMVPEKGVALKNPFGTAPGIYIPHLPTESPSPHLFLLPGPPRELRPMVESSVVPILESLQQSVDGPRMRSIRVSGIPESTVEKMVGEPLLALGLELGYCARLGEVDVRLIGNQSTVEQGVEILRARIPHENLVEDDRPLPAIVLSTLETRGLTLATAESCTGGAIASALTDIPGASTSYKRGFVCYANASKTEDLDVPAALIEEHGAVSEPVASALALGAQRKARTNFAIATTGIAGPSGGSDLKPVGTVFIGLAFPDGTVSTTKHQFKTDRTTFKELVLRTALDRLRIALLAQNPTAK